MTDALAFPFADQYPAVGEVKAVADGVLWVRMPLPFQLNHINLWLIRDGSGWTLVDSGFATAETLQAWDHIIEQHLEGMPITRIIVTHDHPDHIGCAGTLAQRFGCEVWMSYAEFLAAHLVWHDLGGWEKAQMSHYFTLAGLDSRAIEAYAKRGNTYLAGVPVLPNTYQRILHGDRIRIGGQDWRAIAGYGHSPEHISLYCEEKSVLISGDMLLPKISTNVGVWSNEPTGNPLKRFLASIKDFLPLPENTLVLPSHGRPFQGIATRVKQLQDHHDERLAALLAACNAPQTAFELIPVLFGRVFDTYQTFFALAETIAHLNYLWEEGRLSRKLDETGMARYHAGVSE